MDLDTRTFRSIYTIKKNHGDTVFSTLQLQSTDYNNNRRKGLGATLWQEQHNGELKPIAFAGRFLSDTDFETIFMLTDFKTDFKTMDVKTIDIWSESTTLNKQ